MGHFDRGLSRYQDGGWRHWEEGDGLPSAWIDDLVFDGERLWGATEKGVFWVEDGRVILPDPPELRAPSAALFVFEGAVLVAQPGRVLVWRRGRLSALPVPEPHPQRLLADASGVWVAGQGGLHRLANGSVSRRGVIDGGLPADWVTALAFWQGRLLAGTYDAGLVSVSTGAPEAFLPGVWVNLGALAADGPRLAVGEMERGLHLFDGSSWRRLGRAEGLPGEDVSALLFDGEALWVGTRTGLARVTLR